MKTAFAIATFIIFAVVFWTLDLQPVQSPLYISDNLTPIIANDGVLSFIEGLNTRNEKITSLVCDSVQIKVNSLPVQLKAILLFEKDKKFRMIVKSFLGKELDIGSNEKQFWFWSRRMSPQALHYADYKDLQTTRLKSPFHPILMMDALSVGRLNTDRAQFYSNDKYLVVEEKWMGVMNVPLTRKILIDLRIGNIRGHYLYDKGELIASAEIKKFINGLPSEVVIAWYEENIVMSWKLDGLQANQSINSGYWELPNYRRKINMGKN